jgi:spore maturation protein CgeB
VRGRLAASRMRFLIVDTCYPAFLDAHYAAHPELASAPYDEQWRSVMATFFGTADSYSHYLGLLGHDAHEVVVSSDRLQRAWAREHAPALADARGEEILRRQVDERRPDVVYLQNLHVLSDAAMDHLRASGALVVGQIASEAPPPDRLRRFDLVLTSFPHFVDRFRKLGVRSEYFRIGFDPRVLDAAGPSTGAPEDVVFVGALNGIRHRKGNRVLARAARRLPIRFWGYDLRGWPPWSPIRRRYRGEAWGLDMYRVLRDSRVALNRHIGAADGFANNMRLYEATGMGTLLVTDAKQNLGELFDTEREVVAYTDADDLVDRVSALLDDEDERERIARAGQARTLRDHTYAVRMEELVTLVEGAR